MTANRLCCWLLFDLRLCFSFSFSLLFFNHNIKKKKKNITRDYIERRRVKAPLAPGRHHRHQSRSITLDITILFLLPILGSVEHEETNKRGFVMMAAFVCTHTTEERERRRPPVRHVADAVFRPSKWQHVTEEAADRKWMTAIQSISLRKQKAIRVARRCTSTSLRCSVGILRRDVHFNEDERYVASLLAAQKGRKFQLLVKTFWKTSTLDERNCYFFFFLLFFPGEIKTKFR